MRKYIKHLLKSQKLEIYRKELLNKKTSAEIAFEKILNELSVIYEAQKILLGANAITDYYVPYLKMCYEIDGEYHNFIQSKDCKRSRRIRNLHHIGIKRIENKDVLDNPEKVKNLIRFHLEKREEILERRRKVKTELKWYENPVNINPKLRFSFRNQNVNPNVVRRWENTARKIIEKSSSKIIV